VITDFIMPNVDGFRLLDLIKDTWPQLPVILITGYLSAHAGEVILKVITKPIRLDDLIMTVKRILERST
jgi:DNA-binding NtrC family response regulator